MPEDTSKNYRISVKGEEGKHTGHLIRSIVLDAPKGIKALYCIEDKKIITYIFAKNKKWEKETAKVWTEEHISKEKVFSEVHVDQLKQFIKVIAVFGDGATEEYLPNSDSFILEKDIEWFTMGLDEPVSNQGTDKARGDGQGTGGNRQGDGGASVCVCPSCGATSTHIKGKPCNDQKCPKCGAVMIGKEINSEESIDIIKVDKQKQLIYGVFLVPEKADWDGDVISAEDIEKVAHRFLVEYGTIDEQHKQIIAADIVESMIAWEDIKYYGKKITKGTWFGCIKIHDKEVWDKVLAGELKAFSVRIAGIREPIEEEA